VHLLLVLVPGNALNAFGPLYGTAYDCRKLGGAQQPTTPSTGASQPQLLHACFWALEVAVVGQGVGGGWWQ
jgi:hypothetical protein